ncbi:DUF6069 family protein [Actinomycetospora lutea]|uniref:DUF6069 family protein n=1 Tax=Actinomycetospora lutea TaxID=663604 RepID=UPI0023654D26|nr:DUF6069 family protein [Actinomycetospora lutea]MDD7942782.1 DUF6069 family protein [Actinomycetospora lutea]
MSVTTATPAVTAPTAGRTLPLVRDGLAATAVAAVATAAVAAAGELAGIGAVVGGMPIPASGFAVLTAIFSVVGVVLALGLARWARRPRTTFVRTTVVLTVLSLVPDVVADASVTTKVLLMLTHVVAAAIVIPAVARRLS